MFVDVARALNSRWSLLIHGNDQVYGGLTLQFEGAEHLWSLQLNHSGTGEGKDMGVFTGTRGRGTQDDICKAGLEVRRIHSCTSTHLLIIILLRGYSVAPSVRERVW